MKRVDRFGMELLLMLVFLIAWLAISLALTACGENIVITIPPGTLAPTTTVIGTTTTTWPPATTTTWFVPPTTSSTTTTVWTGPTTTDTGSANIYAQPVNNYECQGYEVTKRYPLEFPANRTYENRYYTSEMFKGFTAKDIVVLEFVAPPKTIGLSISVHPIVVDIQREISLSETPCDFKSSMWLTYYGMFDVVLSSGDPGQVFVQRELVPGKRYYLNMNTLLNGVNQCRNNSCDMVITLSNSTLK